MVFAGLTVLIALAALSIINIPFLTAMALSAAATVAIAVLVAITLLPAVLGAFGTKVFGARIGGVKAPDPEDEKPTMGLKWVRRVRAHPILIGAASIVLLALLALPAMNLRLAMPSDGTMAPDTPNRIAYDITSEKFGPGRNAPMIAFVDTLAVPEEERPAAWAAAAMDIQSIDGVSNAQIIESNEAGDAAQVLITPEYGATDERAADVLESIRGGVGDFEAQTGGTYSVTGVTPIYEDISERLSEVLLPYVGIVLALAFVLLMLVFRSIWVPLIAALGFGLSVAATFGLTVAIWQEGWLGIISDPQPVISFLPIVLIGIVFGLAMDYQVFLVTRMREGWVHGKTAHNAVSNGFKHGARVVTAAALIMISVFAAFMTIDEQFIKVMGFALAVAVFFDAFIVRMTIIPAVMFLLGENAWKIPAGSIGSCPRRRGGSALETTTTTTRPVTPAIRDAVAAGAPPGRWRTSQPLPASTRSATARRRCRKPAACLVSASARRPTPGHGSRWRRWNSSSDTARKGPPSPPSRNAPGSPHGRSTITSPAARTPSCSSSTTRSRSGRRRWRTRPLTCPHCASCTTSSRRPTPGRRTTSSRWATSSCSGSGSRSSWVRRSAPRSRTSSAPYTRRSTGAWSTEPSSAPD